MSPQFQKALIIFGIGFGLFLLVRPGNARKPKAKEKSAADLQKDAQIVATAYGKAKAANEPPESLEELNKIAEQEYGMRVYQKHSDGKYYVMDTKGNDIFKIN